MLGASPKKKGKPVVESHLEEAVPPISQVDAPPRSVSASKRVRLPDEAGGVAVPEGASLDAKMDLLLQMMPDVRRLSDL
eukprot:2400804-Amphidinium_carterae.1